MDNTHRAGHVDRFEQLTLHTQQVVRAVLAAEDHRPRGRRQRLSPVAARALGVSTHSVETAMNRAYTQLGIHGRTNDKRDELRQHRDAADQRAAAPQHVQTLTRDLLAIYDSCRRIEDAEATGSDTVFLHRQLRRQLRAAQGHVHDTGQIAPDNRWDTA